MALGKCPQWFQSVVLKSNPLAVVEISSQTTPMFESCDSVIDGLGGFNFNFVIISLCYLPFFIPLREKSWLF